MEQSTDMKAVVAHQLGTPQDLVIEELPDPAPGPGELLVDVAASAVTYPDALMLGGKYQFTAPLPYVPGGEVAGTVVAVGSEVVGWQVGDRVIGGLGLTGGFAERAIIPAERTLRVPDGVEFDTAAGLEYAYGTALYALRDRGATSPGETVLVTGAAGSVGLAAIEIAKLLGATVIAAASSDERLAVCRERGADAVINYRSDNLRDAIKAATRGGGLDVVFDNVGGGTAEPALRSLAWGGRFLVVGFAAGIPSIPLNLTLLKSCQIVGVFYGAMTAREPQRRAEILDQLLRWVADGELQPVAATRVGLQDAPGALQALVDRTAIGRYVVAP